MPFDLGTVLSIINTHCACLARPWCANAQQLLPNVFTILLRVAALRDKLRIGGDIGAARQVAAAEAFV
jgi:hypothetical protein